MTLDQVIEKTLRECLEKNRGNRSQTAQELQVSLRSIRIWIDRYDIHMIPAEFPNQYAKSKEMNPKGKPTSRPIRLTPS